MELIELLRKHNLTIASAESCTGGLVASEFVDISGISEFFHEGYITYTEESKENLIGVPAAVIEKYGVVSEETAAEMAKGAGKKSGSRCAISTTGVAGPTGGTEKTPVGTVCFGCVVEDKIFTDRVVFSGDRREIRDNAAKYAVSFLYDKICEVKE